MVVLRAAILALLSLASAAAVQARALQVLHEEPYANNATIVWYSAAPGDTTAAPQYQQRPHSRATRRVPTACGDNLVTCTSKALARADTCSGLFGYLSDKKATVPPRDSVAVCWVDPNLEPAATTNGGRGGGNSQCCTAWREWNNGIFLGYLLGAATKTWDQCKTGNGMVGGVTNEVNLNGICQSQCLGNTRECF
ncbi:hypothetical protein PG997_003188 [Apiospora hydei]|uniref:Uncharacterized protein n=1 Tax=Apiospora hydei TaxID=1337664 RepID=A0ABR1WYK3_9PEZI